jgi:phosphoserine phosphatase RsbU/P
MLPQDFLYKKIGGSMSIWCLLRRPMYGGAKMITESRVVDVSQDWVVACGLQERFMEIPCTKTQRLTYNARCRQMRALGGDCFHFVSLPGPRVALAVADASGKGLPAALIIANVQSSLRTAALFAPEDPAQS